ncbi:hypothetical protein [Paenibacillus sp. Marseille-Q7038]
MNEELIVTLIIKLTLSGKEGREMKLSEVKILSVDLKRNSYLIKWENEENCEKGIDSVYEESGAIEMIEASICYETVVFKGEK